MKLFKKELVQDDETLGGLDADLGRKKERRSGQREQESNLGEVILSQETQEELPIKFDCVNTRLMTPSSATVD
jgi:hypothetical protein